jgi:hypothetical protein
MKKTPQQRKKQEQIKEKLQQVNILKRIKSLKNAATKTDELTPSEISEIQHYISEYETLLI